MTAIIRVSVVSLVLVASGAVAAVAAPPPDRSAGTMYNRGVRLFTLGKYEDSIHAFEQTYLLSPQHGLLYNIAVARMRLGELQLRLDDPLAHQQFVLAGDVLRQLQDRQKTDNLARPKIQNMIASVDTKADALRMRKNESDEVQSTAKPPASGTADAATAAPPSCTYCTSPAPTDTR